MREAVLMNDESLRITEFDDAKHRGQVIAIWQEVFGYDTSHNIPELVIDKKTAVNDGLFFVGIRGNTIIGTVIAGYDGHRGWIYSLAVLSAYRKERVGSKLLAFAEKELTRRGCIKINLQIMEGNEPVQQFYLSNGYATEKRISMGKRVEQ